VLNRERCSQERDAGVTLVLFALVLTILLGMSAFVIDLGAARQEALNAQAVADAASLAGAQDLPVSTPDAGQAQLARNAARANIASSLSGTASGSPCAAGADTCTFSVGDHEVTVTTPYALEGSTVPSHNLILVSTCTETPAVFSRVWGAGPRTVCRDAVARNVELSAGVGLGIVALDILEECAIRVNGTNTVTVNGGAVITNSTNSHALCGSSTSGCGSFTINATIVAAVGGIPDCVEDHTNAEIVENADPVPDPFVGLPDSPCHAPAAAPCTGSPARPSAAGVCNSTAMQPGRFPSGCNLGGGNGTTQMLPGVYWFQGTFDPRNHDVRCTTCSPANGGVLMFFESGSLSHTGNGTIDILAYQSGQTAGATYAGVSVYQARNNPSTMTVGGTTGSGLGSIYARDARINLHGNVDRVIDGLIVGDMIDFQGTTVTTVTPPPDGPTTDPIHEVGLEE
jgi:Flp pilus assembly protein TadG